MIKHYNIAKDNFQRAQDWLKENVSSEGFVGGFISQADMAV
jgi:hypothetical protein